MRGRTRATRTQAPGAGARSDQWSGTWAASGILIGVLTPLLTNPLIIYILFSLA